MPRMPERFISFQQILKTGFMSKSRIKWQTCHSLLIITNLNVTFPCHCVFCGCVQSLSICIEFGWNLHRCPSRLQSCIASGSVQARGAENCRWVCCRCLRTSCVLKAYMNIHIWESQRELLDVAETDSALWMTTLDQTLRAASWVAGPLVMLVLNK